MQQPAFRLIGGHFTDAKRYCITDSIGNTFPDRQNAYLIEMRSIRSLTLIAPLQQNAASEKCSARQALPGLLFHSEFAEEFGIGRKGGGFCRGGTAGRKVNTARFTEVLPFQFFGFALGGAALITEFASSHDSIRPHASAGERQV